MSEPQPPSHPAGTPPEAPGGQTAAEPATGPIAPLAQPQYGPPQGYAPPPPPPAQRHSRVPMLAAWVGLVAGAVFIVAVIFGTGFLVGAHSGGGHHGGGHDRGGDRREGPAAQGFPDGQPPRGGFILPGGPGGAIVIPGGPGGFNPGGPGGIFTPGGPGGGGGFTPSPSTVPTPPR